MFSPYHGKVEDDKSLASLSVLILEDMIQKTGNDRLRQTQNVYKELQRLAQKILSQSNVNFISSHENHAPWQV